MSVGGMGLVSREDIKNYVFETYGLKAVQPWPETPNNEVLRHDSNKKWFGILMDIPGRKVGLSSDEVIDVLNVKCDPQMTALLKSQPGFAPAYHMNKVHWISILLTGSVPDETIYQLLDFSYELTVRRRAKGNM